MRYKVSNGLPSGYCRLVLPSLVFYYSATSTMQHKVAGEPTRTMFSSSFQEEWPTRNVPAVESPSMKTFHIILKWASQLVLVLKMWVPMASLLQDGWNDELLIWIPKKSIASVDMLVGCLVGMAARGMEQFL
jgi:hypothetical protein